MCCFNLQRHPWTIAIQVPIQGKAHNLSTVGHNSRCYASRAGGRKMGHPIVLLTTPTAPISQACCLNGGTFVWTERIGLQTQILLLLSGLALCCLTSAFQVYQSAGC